MGKIFLSFYPQGTVVYRCSECNSELGLKADLVSKNFRYNQGKGYLFDDVMNTGQGPEENITLITGPHVIADIYCQRCNTVVGYRYVKAYAESQKYKERKFLLEKAKITKKLKPPKTN